MKKEKTQLLFVYNANSGVHNAILDSMHKIFSPSTYQCNLCNITHGLIGENDVWKKFRKESGHHMVFLHKDEFLKEQGGRFAAEFTFPIVLIKDRNELRILISTEELNQLKTAQELIGLLKAKVG